MRSYPVELEATPPPHYDRAQLLVRLLLALVLGGLGMTVGWLAWTLYAVLPIVAAIGISTRGAVGFLEEIAPTTWRALSWLLRFSGFMTLVVDRFPSSEKQDIRTNIRFTGQPTVGSALLRLLTSIPSAFVLWLLWMIGGVLSVVAVITVLFARSVPSTIIAYQVGVLRWQARLVAYHASFVIEYPPFAMDTHRASGSESALASVRS